jgi:quercetin dioxygenase-like cupin family protein
MNTVFEIDSLEWLPVRPEITNGIVGKSLLDGKIKTVLTRVEPGGKFKVHSDKYSHLFYFISGEGLVWVQKQEYKARPGVVVQVDAGTPHAYENTGTEDLVLISLNLPAE